MSRRTLGPILAFALMLAGSAPPCFAQDAGEAAKAVAPGEALFAVVYRAGPSWKDGVPMEQQGLRDHFHYLRDLHARGVVLLAGPLGADGGLVVLRASDQAEAERLVTADPAIASGLFAGRAEPFVPRFASERPFVAVPPGR